MNRGVVFTRLPDGLYQVVFTENYVKTSYSSCQDLTGALASSSLLSALCDKSPAKFELHCADRQLWIRAHELGLISEQEAFGVGASRLSIPEALVQAFEPTVLQVGHLPVVRPFASCVYVINPICRGFCGFHQCAVA